MDHGENVSLMFVKIYGEWISSPIVIKLDTFRGRKKIILVKEED